MGRDADLQLPEELSTLTALTVLHLDLPFTRSLSAGHWPLPLTAPTLRFLSVYCGPRPSNAAKCRAHTHEVHPLGQLTGAPAHCSASELYRTE